MSNITVKLIGLAREFSQKYTISMYELLQQMNYVNVAGQISEQDLYKELLTYPDYTDDWLEYSEDKRCAGWYFKSNNMGEYLVGYLDENKSRETQYEDKLKTCAAFLKHELDVIVQS